MTSKPSELWSIMIFGDEKMLFNLAYLHKECGLEEWDRPHILSLFGKNPNWINDKSSKLFKNSDDKPQVTLLLLNKMWDLVEERLVNDGIYTKPPKLHPWQKVLGRKLPFHFLNHQESEDVKDFIAKFSPIWSEWEESVYKFLPIILKLTKCPKDFGLPSVTMMRKLRQAHCSFAYNKGSFNADSAINQIGQSQFLILFERQAIVDTIRYLLLKLDLLRFQCLEIHPNGYDAILQTRDGEQIRYSVFEHLLGECQEEYEAYTNPVENFFRWFMVEFYHGEWEKVEIPRATKSHPRGDGENMVSSRSVRDWRGGLKTPSLNNLYNLLHENIIIELHSSKKFKLGTFHFFVETYKVARYLKYLSDLNPELNLYQIFTEVKSEVELNSLT